MARVQTGTVTVSNISDPANNFIIASQTLYDNKTTFDFTVLTEEVQEQVISVVYKKSESHDMREKIESPTSYIVSGKIHIILDADTSLNAALIQDKINNLQNANPNTVKELVETFDSAQYAKLFDTGKGSFEVSINRTYLLKLVANLLLKNKEISREEFNQRLTNLKEEDQTISNSDDRLSCSVSDEDPNAVEEAARFEASTFQRKKSQNICNFSLDTKNPQATTAFFDVYEVATFETLDAAVEDLTRIYNQTIDQLGIDFAEAQIDYEITDEGQKQYNDQVANINNMYDDYYAKTNHHFE
jgi:hypothetical protein